MQVQIHPEWNELLSAEFSKPYFQQLVTHLKTERAAGQKLYPPGSLIFNAYQHTPPSKVKVVLLGQDPYHGAGQAMGLSFSVPRGIKLPPSLVNIFKELKQDVGVALPTHGDLTAWADRGVLLLNASLTVRAAEPNSHEKIGWHSFTDATIQQLVDKYSHIVFMLWGKFAQMKQELIDETRHCVLKAAHPSPYSADKGFFGCRHFSRANEYLVSNGVLPIDWKLPD